MLIVRKRTENRGNFIMGLDTTKCMYDDVEEF